MADNLPEGIVRHRPVDQFKLEVASNDINAVLDKHQLNPNMAISVLFGTAIRIVRMIVAPGSDKTAIMLMLTNLISAQWDAADPTQERQAKN